jgi:hypothetical protein
VAYGVEPLQPTNLVLKKAHLILDFNQDGEDFAKKWTNGREDQNVVGKSTKAFRKTSQRWKKRSGVPSGLEGVVEFEELHHA